MSEEWLSTYRNYSDADLTDEITWLRAQSRNLFQSQQSGSRGYSRSTAEVRDRLQAALQVQKDRSNASSSRGTGPLTPDFSNFQV